MKTALLFTVSILCASMAWGQTQQDLKIEFDNWQRDNPYSLNWRTVVFGHTDSLVWQWVFGQDTIYTKGVGLHKVIVPAVFLDLYSDYEKECWADSSYGYFYKWPTDWMEYNPKHTSNYQIHQELQKEWVHREPTFPGFMAWLRKRVK